MRTLTREQQEKMTPVEAIQLLKDGNQRFVQNLKLNRNLLQQVNETRNGQHPFAVIISCMDSRTSAELVFDQGLGDIFSIRVAGNVINEDILGSAEFGCKVAGAKLIVVLGHTGCGAIKGAIEDVDLGNLRSIVRKVQRCIPGSNVEFNQLEMPTKMMNVTRANIFQSIEDIRSQSKILLELEKEGTIEIVGGLYDLNSGEVEFYKR